MTENAHVMEYARELYEIAHDGRPRLVKWAGLSDYSLEGWCRLARHLMATRSFVRTITRNAIRVAMNNVDCQDGWPSDRWMDDAAWVIAERIGAAPTTAEPPTIPQLPAQRFQPDDDTPGLYLQCENREQRDAIMLALGWKPEPPPSLRTAAEEVLRYMDKIGFGDGSTGRSRVQKLLRYALAGEGG